MAGVRSRYADASTSGTPFLSSKSAVAISCAGSFGLWIRFTQYGESPRLALRRSIGSPMRSSDSPAAPKLPSIPAWPIASTTSTDAMPLAIAPVMYGKRTAWSCRKVGSPSCSGGSGGRYAATA